MTSIAVIEQQARALLLGTALLVLTGAGPVLAQSAPPTTQAGQPTASTQGGPGAGGADELAKQLANPVASLISVPFQFNWDEGIGPGDEGRRFIMNLQPVLPFQMNDDWNLIARVIVPIVAQPVLFEGGEPSFGMGDILMSAFSSPRAGGLIWGVGPVVGLPVTSDPTIGRGKYTLGPTAVVLKQSGPWTYGALVNHL